MKKGGTFMSFLTVSILLSAACSVVIALFLVVEEDVYDENDFGSSMGSGIGLGFAIWIAVQASLTGFAHNSILEDSKTEKIIAVYNVEEGSAFFDSSTSSEDYHFSFKTNEHIPINKAVFVLGKDDFRIEKVEPSHKEYRKLGCMYEEFEQKEDIFYRIFIPEDSMK